MRISGIANRVRRAAAVYQQAGVRGVTSRMVETLRERAGLEDPAQRAWRAHKAAVDEAFDRANDVETGGIQRLFDLSIKGDNARHANHHVAADPDEFRAAVGSLDLDLASCGFVDLGSGKGRALMLACAFPFATITGVEFAGELIERARANIGRLPPADQARISLVHEDAACFEFAPGPLVVFLYNPFGAELMARVARRLLASWQRDPRPVRVVYINAASERAWLDAGWVVIGRPGNAAVLAPGPGGSERS